MTTRQTTEEDFGCAHCWPREADEAWAARRNLKMVCELADEPHFHLTILACPACGQRFLSEFTEVVDWVDSDDSQYWLMLPLTKDEADGLGQLRDSPADARIQAQAAGRQGLARDWPKGEEARVYWRTGTPHSTTNPERIKGG